MSETAPAQAAGVHGVDMADHATAGAEGVQHDNVPAASPPALNAAEGVASEQAALHRIEELESAVAKKDAAIKTMKEQAKQYLAGVDKKWQARLEESESALQKLRDEKSALEARAATALKQQQDSVQRAAAAEDALQYLKSRYDELSSKAVAESACLNQQNQAHEAEIRTLKDEVVARDLAIGTHLAEANQLQENLKSLQDAKVTADQQHAASLKQLAALQLQYDTMSKHSLDMQKHLDTMKGELELAKRQQVEGASREKQLQTQCTELSSKLTRAEQQTASERADAASVRQKLADEAKARQGERDQFLADKARLVRQAEQLHTDMRELQAALEAAEATATAARNALASADQRAAEAESKLSVLQVGAKQYDSTAGRLKQEIATLQREIDTLTAANGDRSMQLRNLAQQNETLGTELSHTKRLLVDAESRIDSFTERFALLDADKKHAFAEAEFNQHKRLEAKQELVQVASALEAERLAAIKLTNSLTSILVPRVEALVEALHNLCATLDPSYDVPDDEDASSPAAPSISTRAVDTNLPISARAQEAIYALLEEGEGAMYAATRAAVNTVRERGVAQHAARASEDNAGEGICSSVMKVFGWSASVEPVPNASPRRRRRRINWSVKLAVSPTKERNRKVPAEADESDQRRLLAAPASVPARTV